MSGIIANAAIIIFFMSYQNLFLVLVIYFCVFVGAIPRAPASRQPCVEGYAQSL
jgi:hypothetical protein